MAGIVDLIKAVGASFSSKSPPVNLETENDPRFIKADEPEEGLEEGDLADYAPTGMLKNGGKNLLKAGAEKVTRSGLRNIFRQMEEPAPRYPAPPTSVKTKPQYQTQNKGEHSNILDKLKKDGK